MATAIKPVSARFSHEQGLNPYTRAGESSPHCCWFWQRETWGEPHWWDQGTATTREDAEPGVSTMPTPQQVEAWMVSSNFTWCRAFFYTSRPR